ncbi:MAG: response regulator transcription factor [Clostridium sp.]|uniref:response regulator transcription factor n=1 Tax=Clostridium sp. TaxID=1506 RepID=UPI003D6D076E
MIKVLIVEDENLIRKGLINTIDWLSMDCVIAGEASNGKEGLKAIIEIKPDLVITDIKMPIMNGMDMLQEGSEIYNFEKIILTSYGEFSYAKKAIDLKVFDYVLKPIDEVKFKETIVKVKNKINEKKIYDEFKTGVRDYRNIDVLNLEYYLKSDNRKPHYTEAIIAYVKENYSKKISIEDIAEKLAVSSSYLSRNLKEQTNQTFHDFLNRYRVQKSIELLMIGEYRVYEISSMVGFTDYKHYSTVFKKYIKASPLEFVKANLYLKKENENDDE